MKFSIIIPVYNREKFIRKCLDSVLKQTYDNYEVIIVNDGSTDNSENIIKEFTQNDKRFKLYNKKNSGVADTRNFGVNKVTGDYILFLDSDDYYEVNLLKTLNKQIDGEDIIKFKCQLVDDIGIIKRYNLSTFENLTKLESLKKLVTDEILDVFWLYAFNTKFYKKNNFKCMEGCLHEDFGLIPYILLKAKSYKAIDYIGYDYYKNDVSITGSLENESKRIKDFTKQYFNLINKIINDNSLQEEKDIILIYVTDCMVRKYSNISKCFKKEFNQIIKHKRIYKNLPDNTLKRRIKKIALKVDAKLYLYITKLGRK